MKKLIALISVLSLTWIFQEKSIAANPDPPEPIAGEPGDPDPKHPGVCITKYDQKYPCAEIPPPPPSAKNGVPPPPAINRGDGWQAQKYKDGMYDGLTVGDQHGGLNQEHAFAQYDKVLLLCIEHNVQGRPDDLCTLTPNDPECLGLTNTMQNATTCDIPAPPGSPPGAACKSYGALGYAIDEWLVFGEQYYNGMGGCLTAKDGPDKANARANRLMNITDITNMSLAAGSSTATSSEASSITGKTKIIQASTISQDLSEKYNDGASALGLERGEFFARALKGQSFSKVFSESPFADKITSVLKDKLGNALANSNEIREKVKEKRIAKAQKIKEQKESKGESTLTSKTAIAKASAEAAANEETAIVALEKSARAPASLALAKELELKTRANGIASLGAEKNTNALIIANSEAHTKESNFAAAETTQPNSNGEAEISLFKRVNSSYRRITPTMNLYLESKTARDIRLTDTPEFFKDL